MFYLYKYQHGGDYYPTYNRLQLPLDISSIRSTIAGRQSRTTWICVIDSDQGERVTTSSYAWDRSPRLKAELNIKWYKNHVRIECALKNIQSNMHESDINLGRIYKSDLRLQDNLLTHQIVQDLIEVAYQAAIDSKRAEANLLLSIRGALVSPTNT